VSAEVVAIQYEPSFWDKLSLLLRITKPIVDAIGNLESRDSNLADCMLELLRIANFLRSFEARPRDDTDFIEHARSRFNAEFDRINSPFYTLSLFLHPLCRKIAIPDSQDITNPIEWSELLKAALGIAHDLEWDAQLSTRLVEDLVAYRGQKPPFTGGFNIASDWWRNLAVIDTQHPLRVFALLILSVVPHSAEVERLFSNLGSVQSVRRSSLSVDTLETLGTLRTHYFSELSAKDPSIGQRRKHAHMHTTADGGSRLSTINSLDTSDNPPALPFNIEVPPDDDEVTVDPEEPDLIRDELESLFGRLEHEMKEDIVLPGNRHLIRAAEMYALDLVDDALNGKGAADASASAMVLGGSESGDGWDPKSLLENMGIS
jgi:hypothetical protein